MAVEARHLNLFHSQLLGNREMMNPIEGNAGFYNTQMAMGVPTTTTVAAETTTLFSPMYGCSVFADSKQTAAVAMKSDSGLTAVSRKRPRIENHNSAPQTQKAPTLFSFLGEDLSVQIHQHQSDIDRLVSQHMEKVRVEVESRRRQEARRIVEAMAKRVRAKEEEIEKMGKLNWALEERVKSLCVENQIWRDLARTNEATANALRTNLEQVLAHQATATATAEEDAESCCESRADGDGWRVVENNSLCRSCGKEESCVLLLPCRHLCLCATCGSKLHTCPLCKATKNASVHVNMSS